MAIKKLTTQIFKFWFQIWNQREKLYENHYMSRRILIQSWYKINRHKPIIEDIRSRGPVPGNITVLLLRLNFEKKNTASGRIMILIQLSRWFQIWNQNLKICVIFFLLPSLFLMPYCSLIIKHINDVLLYLGLK